MRGTGIDLLSAAYLHQRSSGVAQGTGSVHQIVKEDAGLSLHIANDVHYLAEVGFLAALIHNGQIHVNLGSKVPSAAHGAGIRRDHHEIVMIILIFIELFHVVLHKYRRTQHVVHRNVKETLDLRRVEVHSQHPVCPSGNNHVGHQLGGDGGPGLSLSGPDGHSQSRASRR